MDTRVCSVDGCGKWVEAKGLCIAHYKRLYRYGSPEGGGRSRRLNNGPCRVQDCEEPSYKGGLCNAHYIRRRRKGDVVVMDETAYAVKFKEWNAKYPGRSLSPVRKTQEENILEARMRTASWRKANPDKVKLLEMERALDEDRRASLRVIKAMRKRRVRQASPPWLTKEHWKQIRAVYEESRRLTKETGIPHEVDHIVPLQGKTVCGLHVPWNLRAIPKVANNRRPRVWTGDDDAEHL